jgi:hypothetical protein
MAVQGQGRVKVFVQPQGSFEAIAIADFSLERSSAASSIPLSYAWMPILHDPSSPIVLYAPRRAERRERATAIHRRGRTISRTAHGGPAAFVWCSQTVWPDVAI